MEVTDAVLSGRNRNRSLLSHLREGDKPRLQTKQGKFLQASLKKKNILL